MGLIGDLAKGFLIVTVAFWIFAILEFVAMGQIAIALLFLVTLLIPLFIITNGWLKDRKKKENSEIKCQE